VKTIKRIALVIGVFLTSLSSSFADEGDNAAYLSVTLKDTNGNPIPGAIIHIRAWGDLNPCPPEPEWGIPVDCTSYEVTDDISTNYYFGCGYAPDWCWVEGITARLELPPEYRWYWPSNNSDQLSLTEFLLPPENPGATLYVNWELEPAPGFDEDGIPVVLEIFWDPPSGVPGPGDLMRVLVNYPQSIGSHSVHWSGIAWNGDPAPDGTYSYRLRIGKCTPETIPMSNYHGGEYDFNYDVPAECDTTCIEEFYRALAERYAPVFNQDWYNGGNSMFSDFIMKFDFDLDWHGSNNYEHNCFGDPGCNPNYDPSAHVYYSVVETDTHWFITYADFHPEDYKVIGGHENDMEGVIVGVEKANLAFGRHFGAITIHHGVYERTSWHWILGYLNHPVFLETMEHPYWEAYGTHLIVYSESEGHGVWPFCSDDPEITTFCEINALYGGKVYSNHLDPEAPPGIPSPDDNLEFVHYELIEISKSLWPRRYRNYGLQTDTYDDRMTYSHPELSLASDDYIGGAFNGDNGMDDRANPPWGWPETPLINRGDLFFNPAWVWKEWWGISGWYLDNHYSMEYTNHYFVGPTARGLTIFHDLETYSTDVNQPLDIEVEFDDPNNKTIETVELFYSVLPSTVLERDHLAMFFSPFSMDYSLDMDYIGNDMYSAQITTRQPGTKIMWYAKAENEIHGVTYAPAQAEVTPSDNAHWLDTRYLGDINGDGCITNFDYLLLFNHVEGTELLEYMAERFFADVNSDGDLDCEDLEEFPPIYPFPCDQVAWRPSEYNNFVIAEMGIGHGDPGTNGVVIPVTLENDEEVQSMLLRLELDSGTMELTDNSVTTRTENYNVHSNPCSYPVYEDMSLPGNSILKVLPGEGSVLDLTFNISDSLQPGSYHINLVGSALSDTSGNKKETLTLRGKLFIPELPPVSLICTPIADTLLSPGDTLTFNTTITNHSDSTMSPKFFIYGTTTGPDSITFLAVDTTQIMMLPPGGRKRDITDLEVPLGAPQGHYIFTAYVVSPVTDSTFDEDPFGFQVDNGSNKPGYGGNQLASFGNDMKPWKVLNGWFGYKEQEDSTIESFTSLPIPKSFSISQNYPNPFNPSTTIEFAIPESNLEGVKVNLSIFNVRGQLIKTLVNEIKSPGYYEIHWNGTNDWGERVSSGIYFYQIVAGDFRSTKKLVVLK